jgi:hypothetical protein
MARLAFMTNLQFTIISHLIGLPLFFKYSFSASIPEHEHSRHPAYNSLWFAGIYEKMLLSYHTRAVE